MAGEILNRTADEFCCTVLLGEKTEKDTTGHSFSRSPPVLPLWCRKKIVSPTRTTRSVLLKAVLC